MQCEKNDEEAIIGFIVQYQVIKSFRFKDFCIRKEGSSKLSF